MSARTLLRMLRDRGEDVRIIRDVEVKAPASRHARLIRISVRLRVQRRVTRIIEQKTQLLVERFLDFFRCFCILLGEVFRNDVAHLLATPLFCSAVEGVDPLFGGIEGAFEPTGSIVRTTCCNRAIDDVFCTQTDVVAIDHGVEDVSDRDFRAPTHIGGEGDLEALLHVDEGHLNLRMFEIQHSASKVVCQGLRR